MGEGQCWGEHIHTCTRTRTHARARAQTHTHMPGITCSILEMGLILSWAFSRQCSRAAMKVNCCCWKSLYFCSMLRRDSFTSFIVALRSHRTEGVYWEEEENLEARGQNLHAASDLAGRKHPPKAMCPYIVDKEAGPGSHMLVLGPSCWPPLHQVRPLSIYPPRTHLP